MLKKRINYYKKVFFISILVFFISLILIKFAVNLVKSSVQEIISSKKFNQYLLNQFKDKIETIANHDLNEKEIIFYKENVKKIYIKFKPILDEIYPEK